MSARTKCDECRKLVTPKMVIEDNKHVAWECPVCGSNWLLAAHSPSEVLDSFQNIYETRVRPQQEAYWNGLTEEQKSAAMAANREIFEEFKPNIESVNCSQLGWHTDNGEGICKYCGVSV